MSEIPNNCAGQLFPSNASGSNFPVGLTNVGVSSFSGATCSFNVTVTASNADLVIAKSHNGNFGSGQVGAQYTLTVKNTGAQPTNGSLVTVVDNVPLGMTATAGSGTGWTCTLGTGGGSVSCTRSDVLNSGASYPDITVTVNVDKNLSGNATNTANVSGGGQTITVNDTATDLTIVNKFGAAQQAPAPDLTITKTHAGNFAQGDIGKTYTITVTNSGNAPTTGNASVSDILPPGEVATSISGTNWNCTQPAGPCTRSDALGAGSSYPPITLTVNVACNAPALLTNKATVSGGGESNVGNDTANDPTTINPGNTPPPAITCPGSITRFADPGQLGAFINPGTPNVSGGCAPTTIGALRSDGKPLNALYPIGTTTIQWFVTDANNKSASCTQTIIVMLPDSPIRRHPGDEEFAMAAVSLLLSYVTGVL